MLPKEQKDKCKITQERPGEEAPAKKHGVYLKINALL